MPARRSSSIARCAHGPRAGCLSAHVLLAASGLPARRGATARDPRLLPLHEAQGLSGTPMSEKHWMKRAKLLLLAIVGIGAVSIPVTVALLLSATRRVVAAGARCHCPRSRGTGEPGDGDLGIPEVHAHERLLRAHLRRRALHRDDGEAGRRDQAGRRRRDLLRYRRTRRRPSRARRAAAEGRPGRQPHVHPPSSPRGLPATTPPGAHEDRCRPRSPQRVRSSAVRGDEPGHGRRHP